MESGIGLKVLQDMLRPSHIRQTMPYAHLITHGRDLEDAGFEDIDTS